MASDHECCTCPNERRLTTPFCRWCVRRLLWAFSAILYGLHDDADLPSAFPGRN